MSGSFNEPVWDALEWDGLGPTGFVTPTEIVCISGEVIFTVEIEGEFTTCEDDE
jgi:hypothetical protein